MKPDIADRADIERLIDMFYTHVKDDKTIGFFFTEVAQVDWASHLPVMYTFWENIAFDTGGYSGQIMRKHLELNAKSPLKPEHFQHWIELFIQTTDELFTGDKATLIKQRAISIATIMQIKLTG